jgi:hypothetical protein
VAAVVRAVNEVFDAIGKVFVALATITGFAGVVVAWRRHLAQTKADTERRITESFSKAIEQLGSDKLEVRLGGIYTLERIACERRVSCTRFLWTRHCRSRNREEQRDGQRDRRDGCGCWGCGQRGRAALVRAVHGS